MKKHFPVLVFSITVLLLFAGVVSVPEAIAQSREVRVVNVSGAVAAMNVTVPIELVAQGNEAAIGFTLTFNPLVLNNPVAAVGSGVAGATLFVNPNEASMGKLGITLAMPIGQVIPAGVRQILSVTFGISPAAMAGTTPVDFSDQLVKREISDGNANVLAANYTQGTITIVQPNPIPVLTGLDPATVTAGSPGFTLTVTGTGFLNISFIRVAGSQRATTFVSPTQLTAQIPATDIALAGSSVITVQTPGPGGGISNEIPLTINNPVPTISSISPNSANVGTNGVTLTINGTNFVTTSKVRWRGEDRPTTFVSSSKLTVQLPASDLATPGTAEISVFNPAPAGGTSNVVDFSVVNPVPTIADVKPASVIATTREVILTITGTGYLLNKTEFKFNGQTRPSTWDSGTQLTINLAEADLRTAGTVPIVLTNPPPGGGDSSPFNFTILPVPVARIEITPQNPTIKDMVTINLSGSWPNGCVPQNPQVDVVGAAVRISTSNSSEACTQAITSWSLSVQQKFPSGNYNVQVTHQDAAQNRYTIGQASFTVTDTLANVSAASFWGEQIATESIIAAFGNNLSTRAEVATTIPLPTELAGTTVKVKDSVGEERAAPLFFVAPTQINYQMPPGTATGPAIVTATSGDNKTSLGAVQITKVAPGLFSANADGKGVVVATLLRVKPNGDQIFEPISKFDPNENKFVSIPIDLGAADDEVFLIVFGSGFRFRSNLSAVTVTLGGSAAEILFAGATPGLIGSDQGNIRIPRSLAGRGEIDLILTVDDKAANAVKVNFK